MIDNLYLILGLSLALGMLVGIQREHVNSRVAGIRTFPLITLTGTLSALLASDFGVWMVPAGVACIGGLLIVTNWQRTVQREGVGGLTTEMSIILMYLIGAYLVNGNQLLAVVLTGVVVVLLHFKPALHQFVDKIGEKDLKAVMQFVLITLVILPVLPNEDMGPYQVLNPREIWWMVVLIVGISLIGYFFYKLLGGKLGVLAGGLLGGMV
ncbi:MAG: MgtC/SapB family protein, partial [Solitalea sp.]